MLNPETQPNSLQRSNPLVLPTSYIQALAVTIVQPLMSSPILLLKFQKGKGFWTLGGQNLLPEQDETVVGGEDCQSLQSTIIQCTGCPKHHKITRR